MPLLQLRFQVNELLQDFCLFSLPLGIMLFVNPVELDLKSMHLLTLLFLHVAQLGHQLFLTLLHEFGFFFLLKHHYSFLDAFGLSVAKKLGKS